MNTFGFVLDAGQVEGRNEIITNNNGIIASPAPTTSSFIIPTPQIITQQPVQYGVEDFLELYGLAASQLQTDRGLMASQSFQNILSAIEKEELSLAYRIALAQTLLDWHRVASETMKMEILSRYQDRILEVVQVILADADGANLLQTAQKAALQLAVLLQRQVHQNKSFQKKIYFPIVQCLTYLVDRKLVLREASTSQQQQQEEAPAIRCETLRVLLDVLPDQVDGLAEVKAVVALLLRLAPATQQAPKLQKMIIEQISTLRVDDGNVWNDHMDALLSLYRAGHREVLHALKRCQSFFSAQSQAFLDNLDELLDQLGFDELQKVLEQVEPAKLVRHVQRLVQQLTRGPFVPCVAALGTYCLSEPRLYLALFKLLAEIGTGGGEEGALAALKVLAQIAKGGLVKDVLVQSALLECVNVLKDVSRYGNIFRPDTLSALELCAAACPATYKNIVAWNRGKSALPGDKKKYLLEAGSPAATTPVKKKSGLLGLFSSKKVLVSPSPHSQTMAAATAATAGAAAMAASKATTLPPPPAAPTREGSGTTAASSAQPPTPNTHIDRLVAAPNVSATPSAPVNGAGAGGGGVISKDLFHAKSSQVAPAPASSTPPTSSSSTAQGFESFSAWLARQQEEPARQSNTAAIPPNNFISPSAPSSSLPIPGTANELAGSSTPLFPKGITDIMAPIDYGNGQGFGLGFDNPAHLIPMGSANQSRAPLFTFAQQAQSKIGPGGVSGGGSFLLATSPG
eukprot:scaffold4011_cov197-Ochromonas_danica.AAC.24